MHKKLSAHKNAHTYQPLFAEADDTSANPDNSSETEQENEGEISNEKDPAKVLLLEDKYMKEFNTKKEALERDYNNRLSSIEKNIKGEISKKAQKDGYDYVFAKSVVLYGGKDITNEISANVK